MDSEARFWISIWAGALIAFAIFMGVIAVGVWNANIEYAKAQSECTARGGSWIPLSDYKALCLQIAKVS